MFNSLKLQISTISACVIYLTLTILGGCSWVNRQINSRIGEECKTHAYIQNSLLDHITSRFGQHAQVRLGVIPFDVPANFAGWGQTRPDWGYDLAVEVHQQLLATGDLPIVEVLNRRDWPGKKEEFDSGNYGAIEQARNAGFDLVMVGRVEPIRSANDLSIETKIIETESGLTIWYGKTNVFGYREDIHHTDSYLGLETRTPSMSFTRDLQAKAAHCLAKYLVKTH